MKKEGIVRSMTGYGKGTSRGNGCSCYVEMKSVNHKYLEINTKLPEEFMLLDLEIKKIIRAYLNRGSVYLSLNFVYEGGLDLEINDGLFKKLLHLEKVIESRHGISQPLNIHYILSYPGVVKQVTPKVAFKVKKSLIYSALKKALDALVLYRVKEGMNLKKDVEGRLNKIERNVAVIAELEKGRERYLIKKMQSQMGKKENASGVLANNIPSTAEEVVRLKSHLRAARSLLNRGGIIGRELDFLAQEMNREINTLSAKSLSARTSKFVVKVKAEIEKIREQSLNIE